MIDFKVSSIIEVCQLLVYIKLAKVKCTVHMKAEYGDNVL